MRNLRFLIIALVCVFVLALGVYALAGKPATTSTADDPIIVKGGSLTVQCPENDECLGRASNGKYTHTKGTGKINRIIVKGTNGNVLYDSGETNTQLGGRPEIEIYYK
ncbi:MAG: hypothetical protein AB7P14_11210 [Blastocatellales bacterium]